MVKIEAPVNPNYAATVVRVKNIIDPLPNSDNLVGIPMFGMQAIVSRGSVNVGDQVLLFPTECQLSPEYMAQNNLYRHAEYNVDKTATGYIEDNRRVRAIKLRGNRSDCLIMPLQSVAPFIDNGSTLGLTEGMVFDRLGNQEICRKYYVPVKQARNTPQRQRKSRIIDEKRFPEHYDTEHYLRNREMLEAIYPSATPVILTQKLHGTLLRVGNVQVDRKLTWKDKVAKFFGVPIALREYAPVFGSNHVIKDVDDPGQNHYYQAVDGVDLWTYWGRQFAPLIPKDYIVYGELIGYDLSGAPIQTGYTYNVPPNTAHWYVYRVAHINADQVMTDLTWDQVKEFCKLNGLRHVVEMTRMPLWSCTEDWLNIFVSDKSFDRDPNYWKHVSTVPLCEDSPCDEGVVIRIDALRPHNYKFKSPLFLQKETALLDKGDVGLEDA